MVDFKETDRPLLSHLPQVKLNNKVFQVQECESNFSVQENKLISVPREIQSDLEA